MKRLVVATLVVIAMSVTHAQVGPVLLSGPIRTISAGPGAQTDPHISGARVSYTNRTTSGSRIEVFDLTTGGATAIPDNGFQDSISDIFDDIVVFTRRETSMSTQAIAFVNVSDPGLTVFELAPQPGARRTSASVGGDTVAFQQFTTASSALSAICVASLSQPSAPAQCLTDETVNHANPDVSPDGNVVVFQQCASPNTGCDILVSTRSSDGTWGGPIAITSGGGNDLSAATNGTMVVYSSDAYASGDFDLYYAPVTGGGPATRVVFDDLEGSDEENPNISGTLVSMERTLPGETNADLWLFDIATDTVFQLPPTADVDEHLNDISVNADGTVHVVSAGVDPLNPGDSDNVYAFSFSMAEPSYLVCPLFNTSRSFKAGRVAPLRIRLCDASGNNLSDSALVLTATRLVQLDTTASSVPEPESPGEANGDGLFRYDPTLGGYIFNLSTAGLAVGTWELRFTVSGQTREYAVRFDIR
jgi:hypothetical protein